MHIFRLESLERRVLLAYAIGVGNDGFDYGTSSALLSDGSVLVGGIFSGTVAFDPIGGTNASLTSSGDSDIFLAKYDAAGALVWVRQFGGPNGRFDITNRLDRAVDVAIYPNRAGGEIFTNGVGPNPREAGEYLRSIAVGPNGEIYMTGSFLGTADFDPGPGQAVLSSVDRDFHDIFVVKLNGEGNLLWANKFGGQFTDVGYDIALDPVGNPYITGVFSRDADFNPSRAVFNVTARGRADAFVMKLSVNGKLIWVAQLGGIELPQSFIDGGNAIAVDAGGNAYVTGTFSGDLFFQLAPSPTGQSLLRSVGDTDAFVAKLDTNGNLVWLRTTPGDEYAGGVAIALMGSATTPDIITAGYFSGTTSVGPGPGAGSLTAATDRPGREPYATDLVISRYDNNGVLFWAKQMGGPFFETIGRIAVDAGNNIYIAGGFEGQADFDPSRNQLLLTSEDLFREYRDSNERRGRRTSSYDNFFASLDSRGVLRFAHNFGGDDDDFAVGISRPQIGQPVTTFALTGRFARTANFDPLGSVTRTALGRSDIWVALFDTDGKLV